MDPLTWYLVGLTIIGFLWLTLCASAVIAWLSASKNDKAYTAKFALICLAAGATIIVWPLTLLCLIVYGIIRLVQDARGHHN